MSTIDVTRITQPLRDARDAMAKERDAARAEATGIEQAGKNEAAQVLRRVAEEAAPFHAQAEDCEAHIARFEHLIAREEAEARGEQNGHSEQSEGVQA